MKRICGTIVVIASLAAILAGSQQAATTPAAPTGATGIALASSVQLAWQPVGGASGYSVYRGTSPTSITTALTGVGAVTGTTYTDSTATNGTTYYYAVRAVSAGVESANSLVVQAAPVARGCSSGNAIVLENCYPGNSNWNVRNTATIAAGGVEGYATLPSINKGDSLPIKINSTNTATVNVEIYRSGYYGGAGARLFSTIRSVPGQAQPACASDDTTGLLDCSNWAVSTTITTTSSWPSGIYLARIVRNDTNTDNQILFVVRDDASHSDLEYGTAYATFESYNNYGGKSLYTFNSSGGTTVSGTPRAVKVSLDRPFEQPRSGLRDWYTRTEFATVYWLELSGYDVSYIANTDLETQGALLTNHKAYISAAHDEYVSGPMRSAMESARNAGVNLFFSGSNEVYWKIRYENNGRTQVCYKTVESGGADPVTPTTTWRDPAGPNQPENALTGEQYIGDNDTTYFPLVVTAAQGADRIYRYTGLDTQAPGSSTTIGSNLVGWEWDARVNNGSEPAGVVTLSGSPVNGELVQGNGHSYIQSQPATVSMVKYKAASGALVVTTGTNHWNRGLANNADGVGEPDVRIQQTTTNILEDMGAVPSTPASNITLDAAGNRPPAPTGVAAATVGADQIQISWSPVANAQGYNVYRSLAPRDGGQPLGALANGQLLTGTTYTDIGLTSATPYYYVVTAVVGGVQSPASNEATATTAAAAGQAIRINAGGPDYTSTTGALFRADTLFTGGSVSQWNKTITGTTDQPLYQDERWGQFSYAIPVTNGRYDVRFYFAEDFYAAPCTGKRVFSMDIVDTTTNPDLPNIDICKDVGPLAADIKTVSNVQITDGVLNIRSVYGAADDPEVTAIEVIPRSVNASVISTTPVDGGKDIPVSTTVTARFSTAMDASTITSSSFTLKNPSGTAVPATVTYDSSTNTATLDPTSALAFGTVYTAAIAATVKAADGSTLAAPVSWSFTTHQPHPPGVNSTFPSGGATGLSPAVKVSATFDQALDPSTVTSSSFTLKDSGGTQVPATVAYDSSTLTTTLTPNAPLANGTTYTANLAPTIAAPDGVTLAGAVSWTFTTAATPPAPPTVTSVPASGATGVLVSAGVQATFSRDMIGSTITGSSYTLSGPGGAVAATVSYDAPSRTATLNPSSPLAPGTGYTATLAASITAADATPLGSPISWTFTTAAAPTVTTTTPADGATYVGQSAAVTAAFSRDMASSSLSTSSFTLKDGGGNAVASTVTYNTANRVATLTPTSSLAGGATYTATVTTGATGSDGTPLAQPVTWSFTTASCPCTLFSDVLQPTSPTNSTQDGRTGTGPFTYEMGVKIVVDQPMQLTSFRFFKSAGETGTHTGRLWSSSGTLLASQAFAGETASGWQTQALSSPVTLQPGSTYVLSVNENAFFPVTPAALATSIVSGPVRTVADGSNGVYGNAAGTFPSQSYNTSNYFVDGVLVPNGDPGPLGVTSTTPANGATGVARGTAITVQFSRAADASTLTGSSFQLTGPSGAVAGTISYNASNQTATLNPTAALAYSTTYTAKVTTAVRAADGMPLGAAVQWSFTTLDPVRPQVVQTVPTAGATDAATTSTVKAVFSKSMDQTTITGSTFTLTGPSGAVAASVSYNDATLTATLTPSSALTAGATYTARLDGSVSAADQATLGTPFTWTFTVANGTLPPLSLTATSPAGGASFVARSTTVTATFSRSVDPATVNATSFTVADGTGAIVPASVTYNDATKTATLTPNAQLAGGATYTAKVATTVKGLDGNGMASAATWSFTTAACPCTLFSNVQTPATTQLAAADGRTGAGPFTLELGVKVTVDQPTTVSALRFYKSPGETGAHTGRIWAGSTQIASVNFTNETASGWQQQALSPTVTLQPGTTYTVSVNANSFFVDTRAALLNSVSAGPAHTVADGLNGVYALAAGQFPTQSFDTSNYFVDLQVSPGGTPSAPTVTATSPTSGQAGVSRTAQVTATFSASMDPASLTGSTFTLTGPSGAVAGTVTYNDTTHVATLAPSAPLSYSAVYTARIDSSVRSLVGVPLAAPVSWSFTVADAVAPTVTSTVPAAGASGVSTSVVVKATFSKAMDSSTITSSSYTLTGPSGAVTATVAYDAASNTASLTPSAALAPGSYTARLAGTVAATDASTLGTAFSWSFTVPTAPVPLTVTPGSPANGATGVNRDAIVTATFNRAIDTSTLNTSTFLLKAPDGSTVPASVSYDAPSRTATLIPNSMLTASAIYTAQVTTGLHADDGTALASTAQWAFTTGACPCTVFASTLTPTSTGNSTQDGRTGTGPFTYELGMKFTVTSAVQLTKIRFYKSPGETGTHVGRLWAGGTQLASVTFTNETASGWQEQILSSPVTLQPGTTYTVSVNANAFFVVTPAGLATSQGTGPIRSVADGANGMFGLAAGQNPTQSYNNTNYFVDAVVR